MNKSFKTNVTNAYVKSRIERGDSDEPSREELCKFIFDAYMTEKNAAIMKDALKEHVIGPLEGCTDRKGADTDIRDVIEAEKQVVAQVDEDKLCDAIKKVVVEDADEEPEIIDLTEEEEQNEKDRAQDPPCCFCGDFGAVRKCGEPSCDTFLHHFCGIDAATKAKLDEERGDRCPKHQ